MKNLSNKIYQVLRREIGLPTRELSNNLNFFNDLGMDSFDIVCLVNALEMKFNFNISDEEIPRMETIGNLIQVVNSK
ncbi:MAG: hypothetical protein B6I24_04595 [Bacteroidetes bacterium 4572_128]|nr:MAG: hypothetical protein B6I24_04595 [Bacteroidetes bacterium 4572_128]